MSERINAANFIAYTTVTPLAFGKSFTWNCFFCKQHFTDIEKVLEHTRTHENLKRAEIFNILIAKEWQIVKVDISELSCRICQQKQPDLQAMRTHLINEHGIVFEPVGDGVIGYNLAMKNGHYHCHKCSKKFPTFFQLHRHITENFSNVVCETCGATFMSLRLLRTHTEIHKPGGFPCSTCKKVYKSKSYLKFHTEQAHLGIRTMRWLRCGHCEEKFTEQFQKLKHLREKHGITFTFDCETCGVTFPSRNAYRNHRNQFHSNKTRCEYCPRTFGTQEKLKLHLVSHTGERNHSCKICEKSYRYRRGLRNHIRMVHSGS